jgi:hypothetical protein
MDTSMVFSASKGRIRKEGSDVQGSGGCDSNDMLASLLASATVALDTDCRAAKRCIQRAAVLLRSAFTHDGPAIIDVVTDPVELVMPLKVTLEQAKGFSIWMMKAVLNGHANEVMQLARTTWAR